MEGTSAHTHKKFRFNYYIDRKFQNNFMLRFVLVVLMVALLTLGILWVLSEYAYGFLPGGVLHTMQLGNPYNCVSPSGEKTVLFPPGKAYNAYDLYWGPLLLMGALNLLVIACFGLFYSHSLAGPIHNIKRNLREMIAGRDPRTIRIRKKDQFQELADLLNQLIEKRIK